MLFQDPAIILEYLYFLNFAYVGTGKTDEVHK